MGLRVSAEEEMEGLDIGEHGMTAYPDFVMHMAPIGEVPMPPSGPQPKLSYVPKSLPA